MMERNETVFPKQVLLVGGNNHQHQLLAVQISQLGYKIIPARNGGHAMTMLTKQMFDMVLLNNILDDMTSLKLLRHIRHDPVLKLLPILIISEQEETVPIDKLLEFGANDFLQLPCEPTLLRNRINAYLHQKQLSDLMPLYHKELNHLDKLARDLILVILPLGIALSAESNFNKLLERILREAKLLCNADGGTLYLRNEDDALEFVIMLNDSLNISMGGITGKRMTYPPLRLYDKVTKHPNLYTVSTHAAIEGHSINIPNIYNNEEFDFSGTRALDLKRGYRTISNLTIPLKSHNNHVIGVLQLINARNTETNRVIPFDNYQQQVVEALASQAAIVLNNQILIRRHDELAQFEREIKIAREIQGGFLPEALPDPTGWDIATCFQPAREVAGDFYDAFYLAHKRWFGVVVADVCDKGSKAAMFMALIRSLIRAYSGQNSSLHGLRPFTAKALAENEDIDWMLILTSSMILQMTTEMTNNYILQNHIQQNMFATVFFGLFDPETGLVSYINGGHNPPVIINDDGISRCLEPTGPAIGIRPNVTFNVSQTTLEPGETLFAYTDGITDARNLSGEFFSKQRLFNLIERSASDPAATLLNKIEIAVQRHTGEADQFDDITMMAIKRQNSV
ncbi:SpoIIE family protein phosphatase [Anaerolineales bacterium HSG6]|nr:SpoIIE family protein phosphatase [Anaerolineales bacterium HSG6]